MEEKKAHNIESTSENFGVSGMTCASCAISLETHLKNQEGIDEVSVNYPNHSVALTFDSNLISIDQVQKKAKEIGYETHYRKYCDPAQSTGRNGRTAFNRIKKEANFCLCPFYSRFYHCDVFYGKNSL